MELSCVPWVHLSERWILPILKFESGSRTTCCRFLQSFALPDKIVQLQRSWGKQAERNATNDLHVSIVPRLHENVPLSGTDHHLSGPDMFALTRCAVCAVCVWVCVCVCVGVCLFCWVFGCVWLVCVVVCGRVSLWCVAHTLKITVYIYILMYMSVSLFLLVFSWKEKRSLEHLLSMMSAFRSRWPSTMVSCFFFSLLFPALFYTSEKRSEAWSLESAWNTYEKKKTWNHCGRFKASKSRHHGK